MRFMATMLLGMAFGVLKAVVVLAVQALAWAIRCLAGLVSGLARLLAGGIVALGRKVADSIRARKRS